DKIMGAVRLLCERNACVAKDHPCLRRAVAQEREVPRIASDALHGRIDLVERPTLSRSRIAGGRSGAQANNGDVRFSLFSLKTGEEFSERPTRKVVGERNACLRPQRLSAVIR